MNRSASYWYRSGIRSLPQFRIDAPLGIDLLLNLGELILVPASEQDVMDLTVRTIAAFLKAVGVKP